VNVFLEADLPGGFVVRGEELLQAALCTCTCAQAGLLAGSEMPPEGRRPPVGCGDAWLYWLH
jgi:hypothetical protein